MQACPKPVPRERTKSNGFRQNGKATGKPKEISPLKLLTVPEIQRHQQRQQDKPKKRRQHKPLRRYKRLQAVRVLGRNVIGYAKGGFAYARGRINRTTTLKARGVRGKRLQPGDRKAAKECQGLPCICGCCLPVQWAHLIPRGAEATRHDPVYSVPACEYLHPGWMDQGKGVQAKTELRNLATELGRRVTPEEAHPILVRWNYYTWLADRRAQER